MTTEVDPSEPGAAGIAAGIAAAAHAAKARTVIDHFKWLAQWLEDHPEIAARARWTAPNVVLTVYVKEDDDWPVATRQLGAFQKGEIGEAWLAANVVSPHLHTVSVRALLNRNESALCQQVQVGTRTVEREVATLTTVEEVEEPIYEWVCPESWLAPPEVTP